ncbi:Myb-like domain-containing protein [Mycena sanguinolenta]|uniref:Myb-like domain-containing protein n=1 Tax=Mycena sanguinolenta TaxID=230812 RepID=A0A8H7CFU5_9AGAR|nr:Myb-like domain-containing protein [Mycena sanguinolenta]
MAKKKASGKENATPDSLNNVGKRCRWNTDSDAILIGQLAAEKAAGNQTDNAGWHSTAWTASSNALKGSEGKSGGCEKSPEACQTRWGTLKKDYLAVKSLRDKSGWGWDDVEKRVVVEDSVWDALLIVNPKLRKWRTTSFPLYDEIAALVDGAVATGERAFLPTQPAPRASSPEWPDNLPDDDPPTDMDDGFPLDPILKGSGGRFEPTSASSQDQSSATATSQFSETPSASSSETDELVSTSSVSRRRVRAVSISDSPPAKRHRRDGHGRKPSNSHAMLAVSEALAGIGAALKAESSGPSSPARKTLAIKIIVKMNELSGEEKALILRLIRSDTSIADAFLAIPEDEKQCRIDYLRAELMT